MRQFKVRKTRNERDMEYFGRQTVSDNTDLTTQESLLRSPNGNNIGLISANNAIGIEVSVRGAELRNLCEFVTAAGRVGGNGLGQTLDK